LAKALPQSLIPGWTEVEILNDDIGRPEVFFSVKDKVKQARLKKLNVRVSMSHNDKQAIAFIVVQDKSSRPQKFSI
jgi:phosphopantetheinyl transferase (holo-ACP synthase)